MGEKRTRQPPAILPERLAWTPEECAEACGTSAHLIRTAIREGKLRACRLGPQTHRILPEEAVRWLRSTLPADDG